MTSLVHGVAGFGNRRGRLPPAAIGWLLGPPTTGGDRPNLDQDRDLDSPWLGARPLRRFACSHGKYAKLLPLFDPAPNATAQRAALVTAIGAAARDPLTSPVRLADSDANSSIAYTTVGFIDVSPTSHGQGLRAAYYGKGNDELSNVTGLQAWAEGFLDRLQPGTNVTYPVLPIPGNWSIEIDAAEVTPVGLPLVANQTGLYHNGDGTFSFIFGPFHDWSGVHDAISRSTAERR